MRKADLPIPPRSVLSKEQTRAKFNASHTLRECIELVPDTHQRALLHEEYNRFIIRLNRKLLERH